MKWISKEVQNGLFLFFPNRSHCSQYNDQKSYFPGLIKFLKDIDAGNSKKRLKLNLSKASKQIVLNMVSENRY